MLWVTGGEGVDEMSFLQLSLYMGMTSVYVEETTIFVYSDFVSRLCDDYRGDGVYVRALG